MLNNGYLVIKNSNNKFWIQTIRTLPKNLLIGTNLYYSILLVQDEDIQYWVRNVLRKCLFTESESVHNILFPDSVSVFNILFMYIRNIVE